MKDAVKNTKMCKDNRGTSMATVVVSFALLLLFVTGYFRVQKIVGNMIMSAKDVVSNNAALIKAYYLEETTNVTVADHARINFIGENGSFYLEATLKKASMEGLSGSVYYFEAEPEDEEE